MYIKIKDGSIEKYPYSIEDLRNDNPNVSFPMQISQETLIEYGVYPVEPTEMPVVDLHKNVTESTPILENGVWKQVWVVSEATYEQKLSKTIEARMAEYPSMTEYLDGIVKGDNAQVQAYIDACLAVKAKYPKP